MATYREFTRELSFSEIFKWVPDPEYNYESMKLESPALAADLVNFNPLGQFVDADGIFILSGDEANAVYIVAQDTNIQLLVAEAQTHLPYKLLARGPAVLLSDKAPAVDIAGDPLDWAAGVAAVDPRIVIRTTDPNVWTAEHTT